MERESHEGNFGETKREDPRELEAKEMSKSSLKEFRRPEHGLKTAVRNKEDLHPISRPVGVKQRYRGKSPLLARLAIKTATSEKARCQIKRVRGTYREKPKTITAFSDNSPWALESTRKRFQESGRSVIRDRTASVQKLK